MPSGLAMGRRTSTASCHAVYGSKTRLGRFSTQPIPDCARSPGKVCGALLEFVADFVGGEVRRVN